MVPKRITVWLVEPLEDDIGNGAGNMADERTAALVKEEDWKQARVGESMEAWYGGDVIIITKLGRNRPARSCKGYRAFASVELAENAAQLLRRKQQKADEQARKRSDRILRRGRDRKKVDYSD